MTTRADIQRMTQCQHWEDRTRCTAGADGELLSDGQPIPAAAYCTAHGEAIASEYRDKLGEDWQFRAWPATPACNHEWGPLHMGPDLLDHRNEAPDLQQKECRLCGTLIQYALATVEAP